MSTKVVERVSDGISEKQYNSAGNRFNAFLKTPTDVVKQVFFKTQCMILMTEQHIAPLISKI